MLLFPSAASFIDFWSNPPRVACPGAEILIVNQKLHKECPEEGGSGHTTQKNGSVGHRLKCR